VNARTLETQVSRLLSDEHAEVRELGERLRAAGTGPAWNVYGREMAELLAELRRAHPELASQNLIQKAATLLEREVKVAPTLVKVCSGESVSDGRRGRELEQAAHELMGDAAINAAPLGGSGGAWNRRSKWRLRRRCSMARAITPSGRCVTGWPALPEAKRVELIDLGMRHRGRHDELLRGFGAGDALRFDILMDIGGFRDMHRQPPLPADAAELYTARARLRCAGGDWPRPSGRDV